MPEQETADVPGVATSDTAEEQPQTYTEEPIELEDGGYTSRSELEQAGGEGESKADGEADGEAEGEAKAEGEESEEGAAKDDKPRRRRDPEKRIAKATRKQRDAERAAAAAREEAARLRAELEQVRGTAKPADNDGKADGRPRIDDFDDLDEYEAAMEAYVEKKKAPKQDAQAETPPDASGNLTPERQEDIADFVAEGRERFPDFDKAVLRPDLAMTEHTFLALLESEDPAGVGYHIATHPETALELARLGDDSVQIARAIGRIEAALERGSDSGATGAVATSDEAGAEDSKPPQDAPAPRRRTTAAPDPIAPVAGSGRGNASPRVDPSKLSPSEYRAWREKGGG